MLKEIPLSESVKLGEQPQTDAGVIIATAALGVVVVVVTDVVVVAVVVVVVDVTVVTEVVVTEVVVVAKISILRSKIIVRKDSTCRCCGVVEYRGRA